MDKDKTTKYGPFHKNNGEVEKNWLAIDIDKVRAELKRITKELDKLVEQAKSNG